MSNELSGITNRSIRDSIANRCFNAGGLVIDETNTENAKISAAIEHTVNGVFQTDYAVAAEIDLSGLAVLNAKNGDTLSAAAAAQATVAIPALAAGDDTVTKVWILACKGDVAYIVEPEVDVAAAQDDATYQLTCPAGYAPFGAIKVVSAPTDAAGVVTFVLGTTALTGVTRQTVTFFDVTVCPATVADMTTV